MVKGQSTLITTINWSQHIGTNSWDKTNNSSLWSECANCAILLRYVTVWDTNNGTWVSVTGQLRAASEVGRGHLSEQRPEAEDFIPAC